MNKRVTIPALVVILLAGVLGGWWGVMDVSSWAMWSTSAGHEIAPIVQGAIRADEDLLTPPQAYRNVPITAHEMSRLEKRAYQKLADYYTGKPLAILRDVARKTLSPRDLHHGKTGQWMDPWRADWVHLGELTVRRGGATATASAEFRSRGGVVNRLDYTYHLVKTRKGWRVDREDLQFEPGYGP